AGPGTAPSLQPCAQRSTNQLHMSRERNANVRHEAGAAGRRMTARSVLLSVLLGSDPPRLPVNLLVSTTELFGIAEGTARTALSRMTSTGELRAADGRYEIVSERLLHRQARQTVSRHGAAAP